MKNLRNFIKLFTILAFVILSASCRSEECKSYPVTESWKIYKGNSKSLVLPETDDSNWTVLSDLSDVSFDGKNNYFCLRSELTVPSDLRNKDVYLGLKKQNSAIDVYADGFYIGSRGRMPPKANIKIEQETDILIPSQFIHDGKVKIALLCFTPENHLMNAEIFFDNAEEAFFINNIKCIFNQTLFVMMAVASLFFIFYSLLQYFIDSRDISYIFFIISVCFVTAYFIDLGGSLQIMDYNIQRPLCRSFLAVGMSFMFLFLNRFYDRKHYKQMLVVCLSVAALFFCLFMLNSGKAQTIETLFLAGLSVVVGSIVYGFMCTVRAIKQGNKDSIPIFIGFTLGSLIAIHDIVYQAIGQIPFMWIQGIAFFVLDLSIFITLAIRQLKAKRQAEILATETAKQKETLAEVIKSAQSLANESNKIAHELNESVNSVVQASEQTQSKITDINYAIQEQNRIRQETDIAVHNLTDFLNNISEEVNNETEIITKTVNQTQEVINGISKVGEGISTAAAFTSSLSKLTKASSDDTKKLLDISEEIQSSSKEILGVVTTLDTFAGQIDLLSMNASIEAAHSGVAGKGFSVIAHEIKNLASQVQQWSARIGEIITNVTSSISESVKLTVKVNNALAEINDGSIQSAEKVNSASEGIKIQEEAGNSISQDSQILYKSANNMQAEVKNQSSFSEQVLGNMQSLSNASNSVDSASLQIAQESNRLSQEAQKLRDMAKRTTEAAENLLKLMAE